MPKATTHNKAKLDYEQRVQKIIDYISNNIDANLSLDTLGQQASFSPFHFHRQFRATTGYPLYKAVQLLRLKRASRLLFFSPEISISDIAYEAGFENAESFSRAFKKVQQQSPTAFRKIWKNIFTLNELNRSTDMQVKIIEFPNTLVAALEHHGPEHLVYNTTRRFIEWRQANGISPASGETYGLHYSDPASTLPEDYRFDICVSVSAPVDDNPQGVVNKQIPAGRCAVLRHHGSREYIPGADYLYREWLPESGEELRDFPFFFHYVNVGPEIKDQDMVTDLYLPIK